MRFRCIVISIGHAAFDAHLDVEFAIEVAIVKVVQVALIIVAGVIILGE